MEIQQTFKMPTVVIIVLVLHGNTTNVRLGITLVVLYVVLVLYGNTTRNISIWYEYGMKTQQYLYNNNNIKKKINSMKIVYYNGNAT